MSNIQRALRIPNANGQVLIENWVEERATEHIDHRIQPTAAQDNGYNAQSMSPVRTKKSSHTALLTQHHQAPLTNVTTYRANYNQFGPFEQTEQGARRKRLEHALTNEVVAELQARKREEEEALRQERSSDASSEYRVRYTKEFESKPPPTTQVGFHATDFTFETEAQLYSFDGSEQMIDISICMICSRPMTFSGRCRFHSGPNIIKQLM